MHLELCRGYKTGPGELSAYVRFYRNFLLKMQERTELPLKMMSFSRKMASLGALSKHWD